MRALGTLPVSLPFSEDRALRACAAIGSAGVLAALAPRVAVGGRGGLAAADLVSCVPFSALSGLRVARGGRASGCECAALCTDAIDGELAGVSDACVLRLFPFDTLAESYGTVMGRGSPCAVLHAASWLALHFTPRALGGFVHQKSLEQECSDRNLMGANIIQGSESAKHATSSAQ